MVLVSGVEGQIDSESNLTMRHTAGSSAINADAREAQSTTLC